ncbi:hypothetical protein BDF21DRAFT_198986 [Thamnidium elegans]|nr:hypothetical protein BDF21DRAFT_198986 [Thamnidium elegans]
MISFHDVMSTYRWQVRFLSFLFGIAETNAFSCYKIWGNNAEGLHHGEFKYRLSRSLLEKVKGSAQSNEETEADPMSTRSRDSPYAHEYVAIAKYPV